MPESSSSSSPHRASIFISYARNDGKTLANRLRDDLIAVGYEVWLDTAEIEGGASWSAEIEEVIERCQITLALLSAGSFRSEICRAEQLRSLRKGKRVIPLLVQAGADRPLYLEHLNYLDFSNPAEYATRLTELQEDIASGTSATLPARYRHTVVTNAPARPPNFLPRSEVLDTLRRMVTNDSSDRRIAITALQGMGGIGKSVMAAALCHDPVIQDAYPDGVVWVTIGREPGNMVPKLRTVLEALEIAVESNADEDRMIGQLRKQLPGKAALIVLDDVWDAEHLKPFIVEDTPGARLLFTTRDASLATATDAAIYRLDALSDAEALQLLAQWVETTPEALPDTARQVADECGNLPLALALCGAQVRDGVLWDDLLAALREADLAFLDHPHGSVMKSIKVSLDALERENSLYARHYRELGVFPEDEAIPEVAVMTLWLHTNGINERTARRLVTILSNRALIRASGEAPNRLLALHDLQHRYLQSVLGDLRGAHDQLLDAYNPDRAPWHTLPDDGYLYDHLAYHLHSAGRDDALDALFTTPDWLHQRFKHSGYTYSGYLGDLLLTWQEVAHRRALAQAGAGEDPTALADCARYALIHTSINSLAGNYLPALVARAVQTKLWTPDRALAIARYVPGAEARADMYTTLAGVLEGEARADALARALEAALAIRDEWHRAQALAALAGQLEGEARADALARGLEAALAIRDERARAEALAALAGQWQAASDPAHFLARLRAGIAGLLWDCRQGKRDTLLGILAQEKLFCPPVVSTDTLAAITRHIGEICGQWRWS